MAITGSGLAAGCTLVATGAACVATKNQRAERGSARVAAGNQRVATGNTPVAAGDQQVATWAYANSNKQTPGSR